MATELVFRLLKAFAHCCRAAHARKQEMIQKYWFKLPAQTLHTGAYFDGCTLLHIVHQPLLQRSCGWRRHEGILHPPRPAEALLADYVRAIRVQRKQPTTAVAPVLA